MGHASRPACAVVGLFDGHDGAEVALAASHLVPALLCDQLERLDAVERRDGSAVRLAIKNAFYLPEQNEARYKCIDARLRSEVGGSGSTAVVAIYFAAALYIANLGDSRAVLIPASGPAQRLSFDQKPGEPTEWVKIERRGGAVVLPSVAAGYRVDGSIGVARALGDWGVHVGRRPQVSQVSLKDITGATLVLGCDGIFDVLSDTSVAELVRPQKGFPQGPEALAQRLVRAALIAGSRDNVSAVVVKM